MKTQCMILLCDDDPMFHLSIKKILQNKYVVFSTYNSTEALEVVKNNAIDILLLDNSMRTANEGLEAIPQFLDANPELSILMSSGTTDFRIVREAMRKGACDYFAKNFDGDEFELIVERVVKQRKLLARKKQHDFETKVAYHTTQTLIGESSVMKRLCAQIEKIREGDLNVLLIGETGVGKEVVARQLRKTLPEGYEPFVAVDSSTIQSSMAESILFGHEKGSFTGAEKSNRGIFEEANCGVVYFDEISNMPLEIQAKLLRVIQEKEVKRLGSNRPIHLNFRVISASNQDLEKMSLEGKFKYDLYQRLSVIPLEIPPLRERTQDIPLLVDHFHRLHYPNGPYKKFNSDAIECLQSYSWPGNIRELSNLVGYLLTMVPSDEISRDDLPRKLRSSIQAQAVVSLSQNKEFLINEGGFYYQVEAFEKQLLMREYDKVEGNISKLASRLKMSRSHLYTKLKEYGLHITN